MVTVEKGAMAMGMKVVTAAVVVVAVESGGCNVGSGGVRMAVGLMEK